jgi:hypothetical protein
LGAGEMDLQVILGSFGHWQGELWLRSLKKLTCFCPKSRPQIQHSTITTGRMTISGPLFIIHLIHWELVKGIFSVILGSFCHWQGGLWLRILKKLTCFAPSLGHKSNTPQPPRTR